MGRVYNENLLPTGGWFFRDSTGVRHTGSSLRALINTVRAYRERNNLDAGDPEVEVVNQLCERDPGYCRQPGPKSVPTQTSPVPRNIISTLSQKVSSWVSQKFADMRMGRFKKVSAEEMRRRAVICAGCPKQMAFPSTCGSCKENVNRLASETVSGQPLDANLRCCSVLAEWTPVSVWLDLPPEPNAELPAGCWRKLV